MYYILVVKMYTEYTPRKGLNKDLLRVIDGAEKIDGHRLEYLFLNLPDKLTGLYSYPEQTKYSYGLRIPVKKGLNLGESLKKAWKGNIKDENSQKPFYEKRKIARLRAHLRRMLGKGDPRYEELQKIIPRYTIDEEIIVQYAWPRKDVIEILTFDEEDEEKFEDIRKKAVQLSNSLFETLKEEGYISY